MICKFYMLFAKASCLLYNETNLSEGNEMENDEQEIKYEVKYVAFLDILGFKDLIEQNKDDSIKTIRQISELFKESKRRSAEFTQKVVNSINNSSDTIQKFYFLRTFLQ